jgi:plasmid stability protein
VETWTSICGALDPCYTGPVTNLTLTIDEETLKRARIRALEQGTSVNAVVRDFLESFAGVEDERLALRRFVESAEGSGAGTRGQGRSWSREDLYEERLRWPRS